MWNEFTRVLARMSRSLIPSSYSRAWKGVSYREWGNRLATRLLESQIKRFVLADGMSVDGTAGSEQYVG